MKEAQFKKSEQIVTDTYKDISSQVTGWSDQQQRDSSVDTSKVLETDDLKWKQIKDPAHIPDVGDAVMSSSPKPDSMSRSSLSNSVRQSPVGDDALSNFVEPRAESSSRNSNRPSSIPPYRGDLVGEIVERNNKTPTLAERPLSHSPERPMSHTSENMLSHNSERPPSHISDRPSTERPLSHMSDRPLSRTSDQNVSNVPERPLSQTSARPLSQTSGRPSPRSGYDDVLDERPRSKVSASPASMVEQLSEPRGSRPSSIGGGSNQGSVHGSSSRPSPAQDVYG